MPVDRREAVASLLLRLRTASVVDKRLFAAFEAVPRQNFVPLVFLDHSYEPGSFPIECGQTMTSADQVARTLLSLDVGASHRVLEIGTGSGYQTALLAHLAKKVTSLDRFRTLVDKAKIRLDTLKITNTLISHADGMDGMPKSLFDRILLNGSVKEPPKHLIEQLASNGVIIAPVGPPDGVQQLVRMTKIGSRFQNETLFEVRMQPLKPGLSRAI
ncbi:protein-L-isoaspartate(D-aspartate) O-methyltransferase [Salaquimonas pukyongi]|uniref:protein-L-isoaspartate(D-aspartate) O-methyltransferase n=1 Tax=Salaquimonas pukyongi TaxID=2712698 RepID=UPI00096B92B7|nr:protein-L-isoaspartate(D-aspartate) O-methyltransferase [Salaquimonas pukyongi]